MTEKTIVLLVLLSMLVFGGCSKQSDTITFTAVIKNISENGIMVDTVNFEIFDKASVSMTDKTKIEGTIEEGKTAEITILGEIRESYPVQVTATKIVLMNIEEKKAEYKKLTPEEAKKIIDSGEEVIILDVRTQQEYDEGHIEGAIRITDTELEDKASEKLPDKNAKILVYCRSGRRSKASAEKLLKMGYTNVYDFGGIIDWPYEIVK